MIGQQPLLDPVEVLKNLRQIEYVIAPLDLDPKAKALRTNLLKRERELRSACLFCVGMSNRLGQPIYVYPLEDADFDFVAAWQVGDERRLTVVQLKEFVPANLNPKSTLQSIIDGLAAYQSSPDLTVAIHVHRPFDPSKLVLPPLVIQELWMFWATSEDQTQWMLCGNMLGELSCTPFEYPH
jgi:hypothetical protein